MRCSQVGLVAPPKAVDYDELRSNKLEETLFELFRLHDLNGNGWLEEEELVQLNSKVAMLHRGQDVDLAAVRAKYHTFYREKLNARGLPVPYSTFRRYMLGSLDRQDPDFGTQEMIVEQFCAEAALTRAIFFDAPLPQRLMARFLGTQFGLEGWPSVLNLDAGNPASLRAVSSWVTRHLRGREVEKTNCSAVDSEYTA
eukprot:CAMPEP_0115324512 /NCGR_PEP_ID=MMETSP0270-20121206/82517_1 /TAXON_ID=71861 /ORGANISM="Scrippsiella trochoidea, Strain CCMP3099" /LENGTH=197 /DNA_ID=CAMNT_0002744633 /DNA_START=92 /DNA_END=686 /DNA_ORIENTATION=-